VFSFPIPPLLPESPLILRARRRHRSIRASLFLADHPDLRSPRYRRRPIVDIYTALRADPANWYEETLMTFPEFDELFRSLAALLEQDDEMAMDTGRPHRMTLENSVLLVILWLRSYPTEATLANRFGVDSATVSRVIHELLPRMARIMREECSALSHPAGGPSRQRGRCREFPRAVGVIDCTACRIQRPTEHQDLNYRWDKGCHCILFQMITDFAGIPIHVSAGWPGCSNDLRVFAESGVTALLGPNDVLIGDKGYTAGPFISPFFSSVIKPNSKESRFNRTLAHYRIVVEKTFGRIKEFRGLAVRWRHSRPLLAPAFIVAAGIVARRMRGVAVRADL